jgi:hypothetical protein
MLRHTGIERRATLKRYTPLRPKPSTKPTCEFVDKTTGERRLVLSVEDWKAMKREMWKSGKGRLNCGEHQAKSFLV